MRLSIRLILAIALPAMAACVRPPSQAVEPAKTVEAAPGPERDSGLGPGGRSGPPPLGMIARTTEMRRQTALADRDPSPQSSRETPSTPPRKPDASRTNAGDPADSVASNDARERPERDAAIEAGKDPPVGQEGAVSETTDPADTGPDRSSGATASLETAEDLMGLTADDLTALLGSPSVVRREAPAQIWQYRRSTCVFDIFLYEEANALRVAYFEARDDQARKQPVEPCLSEILGREISSSPG